MMSDTEEQSKKNPNSDKLVIQNIMRTADGRDYMWKKLQQSCVFETIFNTDPIQNAFDQGRRDFGVQLLRELREYAPGDYLKMLKENIE